MEQAEIFTTDSGYDRFFKTLHNAGGEKLAPILGEKGADAVLCVPDMVYLLTKLLADRDVPSGRKLDLVATLIYVLSPIDLLPDKWKLIGRLDDAYVTVTSVAKVINKVDWNVLMRYWLGDPQILATMRHVLRFVDDKIGSGLTKQIIKNLKNA